MQELSVDLENCYGISKLTYSFDFTKSRTYVIYAPNGVMKTSFANTFKQLQKGEYPEEKIHRLSPKCNIKIDDRPIKKEEIFVIKSFESGYESEKMIELLINNELKNKLFNILLKRKVFLKNIERFSGLKTERISLGKKVFELENISISDLGFREKSILKNLSEISKDLKEIDYDFSNINYSDVFSAEKKIKNEKFQENIAGFIKKSNEIYSQYKFLKTGEFTLTRLINVEKKLGIEKFFEVEKNKLLFGEEEIDKEILRAKIKELENLLKKTAEFREINKLLSDVAGNKLKEVIERNPYIIEELKLENLPNFKRKLWLSYFKKIEDDLIELNGLYEGLQDDIEKNPIDSTKWDEAKRIFEDRFFVPFKMDIKNKPSAIMGESLPEVVFKFFKKGDKEEQEKKNLVEYSRKDLEEKDTLSQGEKRALYLLNIIFEVEVRKALEQKTIFIIDDIADSFDYKNKYAIIEYLKEISEEKNFYQIILTHNFDFFRTIQGRILGNGKMKNCLIASSDEGVIVLESIEKKGLINPFENWKNKVISNDQDRCKYLIALIPFIRNIIEYTKGQKTKEYLVLTHLLHIKAIIRYDDIGEIAETKSLIIQDLEEIYGDILKGISLTSEDKSKKILELIFNLADLLCQHTTEALNLENKVILSIAIRLKAEQFMIKEINDQEYVNSIRKDQTLSLYKKFIEKYSDKKKEKNTLEKVILMTPENIHLNSFMYEPILDMSDTYLKKLYRDEISGLERH